jgi:hypothetical protein
MPKEVKKELCTSERVLFLMRNLALGCGLERGGSFPRRDESGSLLPACLKNPPLACFLLSMLEVLFL